MLRPNAALRPNPIDHRDRRCKKKSWLYPRGLFLAIEYTVDTLGAQKDQPEEMDTVICPV